MLPCNVRFKCYENICNTVNPQYNAVHLRGVTVKKRLYLISLRNA